MTTQNPKSKSQNSVSGEAPLPPIDPRLLAAMYGMQEEDEIDLLEYWRLIWGKRKLILSVTFAVAILAAGISLLMPNIYSASVVVTPVGEKNSKEPSLGGLGGLASMAGMSLGGGGGNVKVNLAVLNSREFLWAFVKENKLKAVLFADAWDAQSKTWREKEPSQWAVYRKISHMVSVSEDKKSGLITVAVAWTDPGQAALWANDLVARLNAHLRLEALARSKKTLGYLNEELGKVKVADMRQALFDLIAQEQKKAMLASTQKEYAFRVLDKAVAPDMRSKPKRRRIVILAVLLAGFFTTIGVFIREGIKRRAADEPQA